MNCTFKHTKGYNRQGIQRAYHAETHASVAEHRVRQQFACSTDCDSLAIVQLIQPTLQAYSDSKIASAMVGILLYRVLQVVLCSLYNQHCRKHNVMPNYQHSNQG